MVGPRVSSLSVNTTGDQRVTRVANEEIGDRATPKRCIEFNEDIAEVIEEVGVPAVNGVKLLGGKTICIVKEETLTGDRIVKYLKKTSEEDRAFRSTKSLARSPTKKREGRNKYRLRARHTGRYVG